LRNCSAAWRSGTGRPCPPDELGIVAQEDLGDVTLQAHLGAASVTEHAALYREAVALIHHLQSRGWTFASAGFVRYTLAFDVEKLAFEPDFFARTFSADIAESS
jgi:hypothetical protein